MKLAKHEKQFLDILRTGKRNAIKARNINMCDREIREIVSNLRIKGYPVCSDHNGYYLAENKEELHKTICLLASKANTLNNVVAGLKMAEVQV